MLRLPYVGVASITTPEQMEEVVAAWPGLEGWQLNIGIQVSDKTRAGLPLAEKWRPRMPEISLLPALMQPHPDCINTIHVNTNVPDTLDEQMAELVRLAGPHLDGFQLNMPKGDPWPIPQKLRRFVESHPREGGYRIILQLGGPALAATNYSPDCVAGKVLALRGSVTDVMLDMSLGQGLDLDPEQLLPYLRAIDSIGPQMGLVVAGGLGPGSLAGWKQLQQEFPQLSLDAESKLRDDRNWLDLGKVAAYLDEVVATVGVVDEQLEEV